VWKADKLQGEWIVDFPPGTKGQYVRIGLDGKGTFHLSQAVVFGD
jgi:hypothetical protein